MKIRTVLVIVFALIWMAVTILSMTWAITYNDPDYMHVTYGLSQPLALHQLNNIAGATDVWGVSIQGLAVDLVFWMGLMIAGMLIGFGVKRE